MPDGKYDARVEAYIRRIAYNIDDVARELNISPTAIAGAIAGEYYEYLNKSYVHQVGEEVVSTMVPFYTHAEVLDNYENFFLNNLGRNYSAAEKMKNSTANDLGYGSVNLGTAITLLRRYRERSGGDDRLLLSKYYNDYASLARDLDNPLGGATEKFAGLMIERAEEFFTIEKGSNWADRTPAEREGLAIWFYNVGETKATTAYAKARMSWLLEHMGEPEENFVWDPQLPEDLGPTGVQEHLANRDLIIGALNNPLANGNIAVARPDWAVLFDAPPGMPAWDVALEVAFAEMRSTTLPTQADGAFYTWQAPDGSGYSISLAKVSDGTSYYISMVEVVGVDAAGRATQVRTSRFQPADPNNPASIVRTDTLLENVDPATGARTFVKRMSADINDLERIFALRSDRDGGWRVAYKIVDARPDGGTVERDFSYIGKGRTSEPEDSEDGEVIVVTGTRIRNALGALLQPPATDYAVYDDADDPIGAIKEVRLAGDIGAVFGSTLGRQIAGSNVYAQIGASTVLGAIGRSLGESIDSMLQGVLPADALRDGFSRLDSNVLNGGIGAISAYLVGELLSVVGLEGIPAEVAQSTAGHAVTGIAKNILAKNPPLKDLDLASFGNVIGSLAGSMLAAQVVSFDTIGGQLGASLGASVGSIVAGSLLVAGEGASATLIGLHLGGLSGPLGAAIGAFVGFIVGGLIGSLFGGTPRSQADASWNEAAQRFEVTNVSARKGGSKEAARSLATAATNAYNGVLSTIGGTLVNGFDVRSGSYGMRAKDFVYWETGPKDADLIDLRSRDASVILEAGIYNGLSDMRIAGGDIFVKRALTNHLSRVTAGTFSSQTLTGDLTIAQDYSFFHENGSLIGALILAQDESAFAAGWTVTLARAWELGLHRRGEMDWEGGFGAFLHDLGVSAASITLAFAPGEAMARQFRTAGGRVIADTIATTETTAVNGGSGNETIYLGANTWDGKEIDVAATVSAGGGDDIVQASNRGDTVDGGHGNDTLYGGRLDDWLFGGDGNDILDAGAQDPGTRGGDGNYLNGGTGDDILRGREGSDWLDGGDGVDQLEGGAGGDVLVGGAGEGDTLHGGTGSDQYVFRRGDGHDILKDESDISLAAQAIQARLAGLGSGAIERNWAGGSQAIKDLIAGGEDSIVFGEGIDFRDVILRRSSVNGQPGMDLIIELTITDANGAQLPTGDALTVQNWFDETRRIEWLKFADGTELRIGDVTSFILGTAGDDVLIGTAGADFLAGGDGNDTMRGLGGNDFGFGGRGKDLIAGDEDDDWLVGGDDDDQVIGGWGNDTLFGDAGNDLAYGGVGNDLISGGRGNDQLVGGAGNDVFRFHRGDGRDILFDDYSANWELVWEQGFYVNGYALVGNQIVKDGVVYYGDDSTWNGVYDWQDQTRRFYRNLGGTLANAGDDTLEFGLDIGISDLQLKRSGNDLLLAIESGSAGSFALIADQILLKDWYATGTPIEHFVFIDVGRLDLSGWTLGAAVTDGDDTVQGGGGTDWTTGGLGNDTLAGGGGNDILSGNAGNDTLKGESGADILFGGAGNDLLDGGTGPDELNGGEGIDIASYASSSVGVQASLANSASNSGDAAGDKYIDIEGLEGSAAGDTLSGDEAENILRGLGGNDVLRGGGGDDSYEIGANEGEDVIEDGAFVIERVLDAAGNLDTTQYAASWEYLGGPSKMRNSHAYRLTVTRLADGQVVYESREDVDFLYPAAQAGPPAGTAWPYSDGQWKLGAARTGNGVETIVSTRATGDGGLDSIDFASGIGLSDLTATWENGGADLRISIAGGGSVLLRNQADPDRRVESIVLADGLSIDLTTLRLPGGAATENDDFFLGSAGADSFAGGAGDDVIAGGSGDDILYGDAGDDILEGGAGADVLDGGSDSIASGHAALANDPSANYGDTVRYTRSAQAISVLLGSQLAFGGDAEGDTLSGIENVTGSEAGNDFVDGSSVANRLIGLGGADILIGNGGDDVLIGGDGNDNLQGGDGDDAISGDAGDDNMSGGAGNDVISGGDGGDTMTGGLGNDRLNGDAGVDTLRGDAGDDVLSGGDGDDFLYGGAGNDTLIGGAGLDTVSGDDGNDMLIGGAENDLLQGGYGNDTYAFDASAGANRILDKIGTNKILFSGVSFDQIWLTRSGSDLRVQAIGTAAAITVQGYFATSNASLMTSISTGTHTVFLAGATALIDAMTAVGALPAAMPQALKDRLANYWTTASSAPHVTDQSRTTNEDTPLAGAVGAVDEEGDLSAYAISTAPAHGSVTIHASTGAWTYTPVADWNGTDGFDVRVTDAEGHAAIQHVAIVVAPVNDGPRGIISGTLSANEIAQDGDLVGLVSATDIDDAPGALVYSLVGNAGGRFRIDADGSLRVNRTPAQIASGLLLDHEAAASHTVRVRVTDAGGLWREQDLTVTVADTNEAPFDLSTGGPLEVFEGNAMGPFVGQIIASDPEGNIANYTLLDSAGGLFELDPSGRLWVGPAGLDFETKSSHSIVVRATDAGGLTFDKAFTITVKDWNEAPVSLSADGPLNFAENQGIAVTLARFTGVDPENDIVGYSLTNDAGGRFGITNSGQLIVGGTGLDYEAGANHTITVKVTDAAGLSYEQDFAVSLTNVNEAPTVLILDNDSFNENIAPGTILTGFEGFDPDGDPVTYSLVDSAGGRFAIDSATASLKVGAAGLDYETGSRHTIVIRMTDSGGLSTDKSVEITVRNVDEAPTDILADRTLVFDEDRAEGDVLAVFHGVDPENGAVTLELLDDAGGRFTLNADQKLRVGSAGLDFEAGPHTIVVRARDAGGHIFAKSFTITVADINEAPTDIAAAGALVFAENQAVDAPLVSFHGVDPEGDSLTYSLRNDAGGRFTISAAGELAVGATGLDREAGAIQQILVRATDTNGLVFDKWFEVTIANVNEAPIAITAPVLIVAEDAGAATIMGTVTATDPDNASGSLHFSLDDDSEGRFTITQGGEIRPSGLVGLNYEAAKTLSVVVRVTDAGGLYLTKKVDIAVTDVNEAPTAILLAPSGAVIAERDRVGGSVPDEINLGVLSAIDPDLPTAGDFATLVFTVTDTRFEIRSGNQLWLKSGVMPDIDYETKTTLEVPVIVTDRGGTNGLSYKRDFTFAIQDRDDVAVGTAGDDSLTGQSGRDILYGNGGMDTIHGAAGDDDLFGGDGADTLYGDAGADKLFGELGNDKLYGGAGDDQLRGGEGDDSILDGGDGNDTLWGGTGLDGLVGGLGDDQLFGEGDNDTLAGGVGNDRLEGGSGDDVLAGGAGGDHFLGGEGVDTVTYADADAGVTVDLAAGTGSAGDALGDVFEDRVEVLVGSEYKDSITGSALRDIIHGGGGNDCIHGGDGDDEIYGGAGDDYIDAQNGGDWLDGGIGDDILVGGNGSDTYVMHADSGHDEVRNYDPNGLDIDTIGYQGITRAQLWFERLDDDLIISAIGTDTVTTITNYFVDAEPGDLANFKIDFITTATHETDATNLEGLLALMAAYDKPVDADAYDDLHDDLVFENQWQNFWDDNGAPIIGDVVVEPVAEDQYKGTTMPLSVQITDRVTPVTSITVTVTPVNGDTNVVDTSVIQSVEIDGPDQDGNRKLHVRMQENASGPAAIRIVAVDPGGLTSEKIIWFNVDPVADAPVITVAQPAAPTGSLLKPTLASGGWAIDLQAALWDQDGSEVLEISISGVPSGLSFNRGSNRGGGVWTILPEQLAGLMLLGPANWSQDVALTITVTAREQVNGDTESTTAILNMAINARPTDLVPDRTVVVNEMAANTTLAANFSTVDADAGDTRTYSLQNNAGGRFQINAETGALTVLNGTLLDYETAASHNVVIRVTDSGGLTYDETVTVAVANVNEAPTDLAADRALIVNENAPANTFIAQFSGADPESNILSYSLVDNADGRFTITAAGQLKVGPTGLDFESAATRTIVVRATDAGGLTYDESFTVTIANVSEAPTDIIPDRPLSFAENTPVGTVVAEFAAVDPEGNIARYTLSNDAGGRFTLDGNKLRVGAAGLNFENGPSASIVVRATDTTELWYEKTLSVSITNVNESPTDIVANRALTFSENTPTGTVLATLTGVDPEFNVTKYELVNDTLGRLSLTTTGDLKVGAAGLDYEAGAAISIVVRATDAGGFLFDKTFTVTLVNVNETPVNIVADRALAFAENSAVGSGLAILSGVDPDGGATSLELRNDAGGRFTLGADGWLRVGATGLNYEAATSHSIVVRATDAGGLWIDKTFTVTVGNVNEAPVNITAGGSLTFNENQAPDTRLVMFSGTDPDNNITSYSLVNADARFKMDTDGQLRVGSAGLNFEAGSTATIVVRATDAGGLWFDKAFAVAIANLNEAPTDIVADRPLSVAENTGVNSLVATLSGVDPEGNVVSYSLRDSASDRFTLVGNELRVGPAGLNYEAGANVSIVVRATDAGGLWFDKTLTVSLANVNESPVDIWPDRALSFYENTAVGDGLAYFLSTDLEGGPITYSLADTANGRFAMDANGLLKVGGSGLDYEAGPSATIVVRATDSAGLYFDEAFTVAIANVNEAPTALWADRTLTFAENYAPGTGMAWFGASDPDGGALTYSLMSNTGGRFDVRSDGLLMVGSAGFNYEAASGPSQSILVRVTDAGGAYREEWFSTALVDINEAPIVSGGSFAFGETAGPGTVVGTISYSDPDILNAANSDLSFSLSGTGAEKFSISKYGVISYQQGIIDQDITTAVQDYSLTVTATDQNGAGLSSSAAVNIHVNAENEAPFLSYASLTITPYSSYPNPTYYIYLNAVGYDLDPTPNGINISLERIAGSGGPLGIVPKAGSSWIIHSGYANYTYGIFDIILSDGQASPRRQRVTVSGTTLTMGPVVLDMDGDGVELSRIGENSVLFDMDGDGVREVTGWVGRDDALLVFDRNGNGVVDNGGEIALTGDHPGAVSDLEGLRAYDSNGNGLFDTGDSQFSIFQLWRDANQDGVSQADELSTLENQGIVAIDLALTRTGAEAEGATDTFLYGTSLFTRADGTTGNVGDAFLGYQKLTITVAGTPAEASGIMQSDDAGPELPVPASEDATRSGWPQGTGRHATQAASLDAPAGDAIDVQLLRIVEAMNGFVSSSATIDRLEKPGAASYDWFASAA